MQAVFRAEKCPAEQTVRRLLGKPGGCSSDGKDLISLLPLSTCSLLSTQKQVEEEVCVHQAAELDLIKQQLGSENIKQGNRLQIPWLTYFQTVAPISLSVYYVKNIFMDFFSLQERPDQDLFFSHRK